MLHSLSYSDPLVNQSEFNNRQHHPHSGMCRKNTSLLANYMEIHLQMDTINYAEELRGVL